MYGGLFKKRSRSDAADVSAKRRAVDATPKKEGSSSGSTGDLPPYTPREVVHYPSTLPFPVVMDDTFPEEPYRSRNGDIKSAIHWGQRKLLLSEIQLLSIYCKPETSYHIVYAGSAPGTHLAFLDTMFASRHTWELVDPGQFDRPVLENRPNFSLRNEFFTNATAYGINARRLRETCPALAAIYTHLTTGSTTPEKDDVHHRLQELVGTLDVARGTEDIPCMYEPPVALPCGLDLLTKVAMDRSKPLLFISDIRSGSVALPNFEDHVAENMRAQACWTSILDGAHSMLKFRLPYTSKASGHGGLGAHPETRLIKPNGTVEYLRGEMVLPIWTRPTSTEGRLVVPQGARPVDYNVAHVENQFFFFNATVREMLHFNHILLPHPNLDHHFDGAAEVHCLLTYLKFLHPQLREAPDAVLRQEVLRVSNSITEHLRVTFGDAIRRRDALMLKQAYAGVAAGKVVGEDDDDDDAPVHRPSEDDCSTDASGWVETTKEMIHRAGLERQRVLWRVNVDESITQEKSKVWVTTKMRQ